MDRFHLLSFIASVLIIVFAFSLHDQLVVLKSWGLLGIFFINFLGNATILLPAPAIASVVAGTALYGPVSVAIAASLGGAMGDMVGFALGYSGRKVFLKNHHKIFVVTRDLFEKFGIPIVFVAALIPNPFFDVVGIIAGMIHFSPIRFLMVMLVGRLIRNVGLAYISTLFQ